MMAWGLTRRLRPMWSGGLIGMHAERRGPALSEVGYS